MDVEKTMEFILEQQAAMDARQDSILKLIEGGMKLIAGHDRRIANCDRQIASRDRQIAKCDRQIASHDRRIANHDRQIKALSKGHRELIAGQKATDKMLKELASLHADTERKLNRLIERLDSSSNGRQTL